MKEINIDNLILILDCFHQEGEVRVINEKGSYKAPITIIESDLNLISLENCIQNNIKFKEIIIRRR